MPAAPSDMLRGTVDVLVLKTLAWDTMHGYSISSWLRAHSGGTLVVEDAALYQALHRLERQGAIASEWGVSENNRRARFYRLTPGGRARLRTDAASFRDFARAVVAILDTRPAGA
jgi:PadR family transcriptional regulator